jgi:hypothetical protein
MNNIFASQSIGEHLLRGTIGFGSGFAALWLLANPTILTSLAALGLGALALIAFRGCPMCWTVGLFNTVFNTVWKAKGCKACEDISAR